MATRNIVLTDHQNKLVDVLVQAGRYQNASEVLREGLRLVEQQEIRHQQELQQLRDAVDAGLDDAEQRRTLSVGVGEEITEYLTHRASKLTKRR